MYRLHLVDDESVLLWIVKEYLETRGFSVDTDTDARAALQKMQKAPPDLVVLDILMPGMDGFSLFEQMRALPALASVPVIFLTAFCELPARLKGFQIGAEDFIGKPFEVSELEARIKAILWRTQAQQASGLPHLDTVHHTLFVEGAEILLTPSETALMTFFLEHPDMLITASELLQFALGYAEGDGSPSTVRYHIHKLRKKFEQAELRTIRLDTVGRSGYLLATLAA